MKNKKFTIICKISITDIRSRIFCKLLTVNRKLFSTTIILMALQLLIEAQHTFSIVAVDTVTMEVGSAGATCLSINREGYEALIISRLQPGIGAIHTQSYWNAWNQDIASEQMNNGLNSEEIIEYLVQNDVEGNSSIRQYGVAHLDANGKPNAAGFTGSNCLNSKKHVANRYYSIQGNILLGEYIVDSMEARFLRSAGSLADRLMEAMKGALIAGADSRCLSEGLSSRSSFLRVAKPTDTSTYYLDIHVPSTRRGLDPIDSLETLFKSWKNSVGAINKNSSVIEVFYNSISKTIVVNSIDPLNKSQISIYNVHGQEILHHNLFNYNKLQCNENIKTGIYYVIIRNENKIIKTSKLLIF